MASIAVDDHRYENVLIIMSKHPFDRIDCETHAMHKAQRVGDAGNDVGSSPSLLGVAAPDPSGLLVGGEPSDSEDGRSWVFAASSPDVKGVPRSRTRSRKW